MTNYLEVTNLSKSFDSFQLHNISFTLPKGYIMGLIGPNGSGKTTTIKLILNMLKRTGGTVKVMGLDNIAEEQKVKSELGVVFDTNYFSDDWKVSQVEKSISVFYPNWDSQKFADMLRKFHIAPTKKVKELSKGMQMKLMLACAFSYDAKLLILDEPSRGAGPRCLQKLAELLLRLNRDIGLTVLLAEQHLPFIRRVADRFCVLHRGRNVAEGDIMALDEPLLAQWMTPDPAR
jgi:ABC-2 type transport system ATP-binding protein